ncbi:MAG: zf-HC2 domain-containing protein [Pseudomonadota bacterium]
MSRECKQIAKMISAYVDGELSPDLKARVEAELKQCDGCRAEYERTLRMRAMVWEVFQQDLRAAGDRSVWEGVEARIERLEAADADGWAAGIRAWLERLRLGLTSPAAPAGVAAALVTVVIAVTLMFVLGPDRSDTPSAPAHLDQVALPEIPDPETPQPGSAELTAAENRRPAEPERPFHRNELYVDSTDVDQGIVIVDVDPEADMPAIVWHLEEEPMAGEDGAI